MLFTQYLSLPLIDIRRLDPYDDNNLFQYPLIGPIFSIKYYFATRHPLPTVSSINPFDSLDHKFWINFSLIYIILVLSSISIHFFLFQRINVKQLSLAITSPASSFREQMIKSGLLLPCLITFTFWVFDLLYGVDLQTVLVGQ